MLLTLMAMSNIFNPPESSRTYSSVHVMYEGVCTPPNCYNHSMLNSSQAWTPNSYDTNQWLVIDLGESMLIDGVVTQARNPDPCCGNQRVTSFIVYTSSDIVNWFLVDGGNAFGGPSTSDDANAEVHSRFSGPVSARYIRISPQAWEGGAISMRAGVLVQSMSPTTFYIRGSRSQIVFGTNEECTIEHTAGASSLTSSCPIITPTSRRLEDVSTDSDRIAHMESKMTKLEINEAEMKEQLQFLTTELKMLKEQRKAP
jgi:hypothetical protein